ncbi:MAG: hypothetical protein V7K47_02180 [Nostoc sp.]
MRNPRSVGGKGGWGRWGRNLSPHTSHTAHTSHTLVRNPGYSPSPQFHSKTRETSKNFLSYLPNSWIFDFFEFSNAAK